MKALILAAGYATRLYPLTKDYPKALLCVKNKPIIDYIVDKLNAVKQIDEIFVITNSKFISNFKKWKKDASSAKPITLIDDLTKDNETRLGAIGDIDFAIEKKKIKEGLLVVGGDNLFDAGLKGFVSEAKEKRTTLIGAFDIKRRLDAKKYGVIKLSKEKKVIDFQEKPERPNSSLVAMCLYYFPKETLGAIKEYMGSKAGKHDATGLYIDWLRKKETVHGFIFRGKWFDIGDFKFYNEAKERFIN